MIDLKKAIDFVLGDEDASLRGNVTTDEGGRTRFGIAEKFHPDLPEDFYTTMSHDDALELSEKIYAEQYAAAFGFDEWAEDRQHIAEKCLDFAVNAGVANSVHVLQKAAQVVMDGNIGPKTIDAVNKMPIEALLVRLRHYVVDYYVHIKTVRMSGKSPVSDAEFESWIARAVK